MKSSTVTHLETWRAALKQTCRKGQRFSMPEFRNASGIADNTARQRLAVLVADGAVELVAAGGRGKAAIYKRLQ